jgi:hypothetical protein
MEIFADAGSGSLEGTGSLFGDLDSNDMQHLDTVDLDNHEGSLGAVCDENTDSQWQLVSSNWFSGQLLDDLSYSPSIRTDFTGYLPEFFADDDLGVAEGYNPEAVVQAAWKSLTAGTPKLLWERNFWDRFLDPNVSAMDIRERGSSGHCLLLYGRVLKARPLQRLTGECSQSLFKKSKVLFNMSEMFQSVAGEKNEKLFGKQQLEDG